MIEGEVVYCRGLQPQREWYGKISSHGPRIFYNAGAGEGVKVSVAMFPSRGGVKNPVSELSKESLEYSSEDTQRRSCGSTVFTIVTDIISKAILPEHAPATDSSHRIMKLLTSQNPKNLEKFKVTQK